MKIMLILAFYELVAESSTLYGEELKENRERRKRMNKRSLAQYGMTIVHL